MASFVGVENISKGKVLARKNNRLILSVGGKKIEALGDFPTGAGVTACLRPERIFLSFGDTLERGGNATDSRPESIELSR